MNDTFGIDQGVLCETVGRNPDGVNNHVAMIPKVASPTLGWRMEARWANIKQPLIPFEQLDCRNGRSQLF
jgi:hypothetical protein